MVTGVIYMASIAKGAPDKVMSHEGRADILLGWPQRDVIASVVRSVSSANNTQLSASTRLKLSNNPLTQFYSPINLVELDTLYPRHHLGFVFKYDIISSLCVENVTANEFR